MIFTAPQIHDGHRFLPAGSCIETDASGEVVAIHAADAGAIPDRFFDRGILCPGFVNAHCHLELSHLKGVIPEGTGLMVFLQLVMQQRTATDAARQTARQQAFDALYQAGVVAIGDIANTNDALDLRASGKMVFHTFVETSGFIPQTAGYRMDTARTVWQDYASQSETLGLHQQSITPHAPYSVSPELFRMIGTAPETSRLSVHSGESEDERELYRDGSGGVNGLFQSLGLDISFFEPYGQDALDVWPQWLPTEKPLMLVHNTTTTEAEVQAIEARFPETYWCLCPNANRYIEGRLPDVAMLRRITKDICIGTDSLASNHQLSVLGELQLLKALVPELTWEELLRWATWNGAQALGLEQTIGSFKAGATPGVVWIEEPVLGEAVRVG
ncbi:MAG: amidohydrolase [Sphingobacteriales bacterium]|nr:MAG: amidohydrolase [Sphingobacteriales bacterium]